MRKAATLVLLVVLMAASGAAGKPALASPGEPPAPAGVKAEPGAGTSELEYLYVGEVAKVEGGAGLSPAAPHMIAGQALGKENEPNNSRAQANPLNSTDTVILANIFPNADEDYFSFQASAGDRVYAATMTSFSSSSMDSELEIVNSTGSVLESDNDDGSFSNLSSSIAGLMIPASQTYYIHVRNFTSNGQIRPYHLHFRLQSGAPTGEAEPNNSTETASPLPPSGWVNGAINPANDVDFYSLNLNTGDTVYLSLDLDPERDNVTWNGRLGLGIFANFILVVNDASTTSPNSEAFFFTVKDGGLYYVMIDPPVVGAGDPTFTYHLSASVHPAEAPAGSCTTYTNTTPAAIPDGGPVTSTIIVPGHPRIADLDVAIDLIHASMPDLDASLQAPVGNQAGLFSDVGSSAIPGLNMVLDDEAGVPINTFTVMNGVRVQPELAYRLGWFDHQDAGGTWTLTLYDDTASNTGTLNSWSITICTPPPAAACPAGSSPTVLYSSDFNTGAGGFTHSGVQDEWELGLPGYSPLTGCNSGSGCWKTDLDNTYNASSSQDLLSPAIDLTDPLLVGPVTVEWAQMYQMESATFDHASIDVRLAGGALPTRLWEWLDATMTNPVGNPAVNIKESAGWGLYTQDIRSYLGQTIELLYHLDSDASVYLAGLAVDDVSVMGCLATPTIYLPLLQK